MPFRPELFYLGTGRFVAILPKNGCLSDRIKLDKINPELSQSYLKMDAFPTGQEGRRKRKGMSQSYLKMDAFPTFQFLLVAILSGAVAILPKNGCLSDVFWH